MPRYLIIVAWREEEAKTFFSLGDLWLGDSVGGVLI